MAGSSNQYCTSLGVTLLAVIAGTTATVVTVPKGVNQLWLKYHSGGSLAMVQGLGSSGTPTGVQILAAEPPWHFDGPASFFLAAGGATSVAGIVFGYSAQGQSGVP